MSEAEAEDEAEAPLCFGQPRPRSIERPQQRPAPARQPPTPARAGHGHPQPNQITSSGPQARLLASHPSHITRHPNHPPRVSPWNPSAEIVALLQSARPRSCAPVPHREVRLPVRFFARGESFQLRGPAMGQRFAYPARSPSPAHGQHGMGPGGVSRANRFRETQAPALLVFKRARSPRKIKVWFDSGYARWRGRQGGGKGCSGF